ncbi:MAG: glycosyltransferase [Sulfobacillus sp.]
MRSDRRHGKQEARIVKVLFITSDVPCFPGSGGPTRNYHLLRCAARRHSVTLLTFSETGQERSLEALGRLCEVIPLLPRSIPPGRRMKRFHRLAHELIIAPPPVVTLSNRYEVDAREQLQRLLRTGFDLIQAEGSHLVHLMPEDLHGAKLVVDLHNVESHNQLLAARHARRIPDQLKGWAGWLKLRRHEASMLRRANCCMATSIIERQRALRLAPGIQVDLVPNGVDPDYFQPGGTLDVTPSIVYSGAMDYGPNVDAIIYFGRRILPIIREAIPDVIFRVVGRNPVPELIALAREAKFEVTGAVDDVRPFLQQAHVVVVPLRFGAGTRLKILEAMACGKAIVSTSLGAEGIDVTHQQDIILADQPDTVARSTISLLHDDAERARLGAAARSTVETKYAWPTIGTTLERVYQVVSGRLKQA